MSKDYQTVKVEGDIQNVMAYHTTYTSQDIAEFFKKIRAQAWDEGYKASDHEAYYFSTHGDTDNPYT